MSHSNTFNQAPREIPMSRLNVYETAQLENASSMEDEGYNRIRKATLLVAERFGVDEAIAEGIVLGRIDATIYEGLNE